MCEIIRYIKTKLHEFMFMGELENFGHMHIPCLKTRFYDFMDNFDYLKLSRKVVFFDGMVL